jgi:hypothetical protein
MDLVQWIVAAGTTIFVATVGYFQWRTAQQKAVLDLFERRHQIFEIVRSTVGTMMTNSHQFDQQKEIEFSKTMERAYFFFGDDIRAYLDQLWIDLVTVRAADQVLSGTPDPQLRAQTVQRRQTVLLRIGEFYKKGQPLFGRYMRFSQTVPSGFWSPKFKWIAAQIERIWAKAKGR